ncbi:MAG: UDP-2,3-diacylglucosamine diphosphatase [Saprospiraceae bacterium]
MKREVDVLVLSDLHLGTYGCHASELLSYLSQVEPKMVVLNGDIIDIWHFNKRYFPTEHLQVINYFLKMAGNGTKVFYITGNHDEKLREFGKLKIANLLLCNQLQLVLNDKKCWFFHGDVFDASVNYSKWIAKLGGFSYNLLIRINKIINNCRSYFGFEKISFSQKIKYKVKEAVKFIQNFEELAVKAALQKGMDYVICGHIHRPIIRTEKYFGEEITYLNSGDWVEHLTSLEYTDGKWSIYEHDQNTPIIKAVPIEADIISTYMVFS